MNLDCEWSDIALYSARKSIQQSQLKNKNSSHQKLFKWCWCKIYLERCIIQVIWVRVKVSDLSFLFTEMQLILMSSLFWKLQFIFKRATSQSW